MLPFVKSRTMETPLDNHKKVLGILFVTWGSLTILGMLLLSAFLSVIFSFALNEADPDDQKALEVVLPIIQYIPIFIIVIFAIPTLIAGIGLLMRKSWAMLFSLVVGCLKLFSFPFGTALGIYSIWIYTEEQKVKRSTF